MWDAWSGVRGYSIPGVFIRPEKSNYFFDFGAPRGAQGAGTGGRGGGDKKIFLAAGVGRSGKRPKRFFSSAPGGGGDKK